MNSQTINENTFIVRKEGVPNPIKGNISLSPDRKTAIFDSEPDLEPNTKYTAEINEGAKDLAGNALVSAKRWSFSHYHYYLESAVALIPQYIDKYLLSSSVMRPFSFLLSIRILIE